MGFALRALLSLRNLQNSSGVGSLPILGIRKERPREITTRAGHSLDREAEVLECNLPGVGSLPEMGIQTSQVELSQLGSPRARCGCREGQIQGQAERAAPSPLGASSKVQSRFRSAEAERTGSGMGQQARSGCPARCLSGSQPPSCLERGQGTESGPENVPREGRN